VTQLKPINNRLSQSLGASSGIGRQDSLRGFAKLGAKVVVSESIGLLGHLVNEIKWGGEATYIVADVLEHTGK